MTLSMSAEVLRRIQSEAERAYPEEGAGFLLGTAAGRRAVLEIVPSRNEGMGGARTNRYLIDPQDYMEAELKADGLSMELLGVFHSHPDHPAEPSAFDRDWAQPNLAYVITSVEKGRASASKCWVLLEDRSRFEQEAISISDQAPQTKHRS